jgi:hypothetical protein
MDHRILVFIASVNPYVVLYQGSKKKKKKYYFE